ncbi:MAG: AsnC family transcriptional regulator [Defluviicoccus sp.]|nr:AsnC family transcriptional regulator [Defluviicoccus sp.]MDG4608120.1 AsnC family transcriptional regulator [Defluviicoccus sp.]
MTVDASDRCLLAALEAGLPLVTRPYAALGALTGLTEQGVLDRLRRLVAEGVVKRFGVIVRHRELGYRANAMVVWDVPDERVDAIARSFSALPFVTLCYQRPRRPGWPYNLFCMIHGKDRRTVHAQIAQANTSAGTTGLPKAVLFSSRAFKQHGARYTPQAVEPA